LENGYRNIRDLENYLYEALSCTHVFEGFKRFREGRDVLEDDSRREQLSTA
jgi:hypothetical protein